MVLINILFHSSQTEPICWFGIFASLLTGKCAANSTWNIFVTQFKPVVADFCAVFVALFESMEVNLFAK